MTRTTRSATTAVGAAVLVAMVAGATGCTGDDDRTDAGSSPSPASASAGSGVDTTVSAPATDAPASVPTTLTPTEPTVAPSVPTQSAPAPPPARLDGDLAADLDTSAIADRLSAAHATIVDASAAPDARERAGVEYQLVLRELADRPELDETVLDALDPAARPTIEPVVRARQFLQERSASRPPQPLPDDLPAWTIVEPEPAATLLAHYREAEALTGIAWYWLAAIHLQETRMGRIEGVSSAGAVGPMQFLPTTWERCCTGDPTVTRDAIIGAATYLAQSGGPDDMAAAVFEYNPNDGYVTVVSAYAQSLRDQPELYTGYHAFQVFFSTSVGTVRLPIGFSTPIPINAAAHLAANPQDAA